MLKKKIIFAIVITFVGTVLSGCGNMASTVKENSTVKSNWKKIRTISIKHKSNIGGFNDDQFGITVGYAGEVHYTTDGGKMWPQGINTSFCRFGLEIIDNKIAYNCGNAGHVRKTVDGGANWTEVSDFGDYEPNQCRYLSFIDENTGWIAAPKKLGSTIDGGKTWTNIDLPNKATNILAISLVNKDEGYIVDSTSILYITKDGGKTWTNKKLSMNNMDNAVWNTNNEVLRFLNSKNGIIFYYDKSNKLKCYRTTDGGDTWKEDILPDITGDGLYLSKDCKYLSVNSESGPIITLYKWK